MPHLDFSRNGLRHWNETWSAWQYHSTLLSLLHLSIVNLNMMATTCAITSSEHLTLHGHRSTPTASLRSTARSSDVRPETWRRKFRRKSSEAWISYDFLTFSVENAWRCRWKYRAGAFSVGSCSENSHLHKRNVKNVRLHMLFFLCFYVPIKSMKQKWGRMPVHWKEIIKIARPESPENGW